MARPKRWYDPASEGALRVIPQGVREEPLNLSRWRHARQIPTLGECLSYPLSDGPGLGLLAFFPPVLWLLSLPVFDFIAVLQPLTKGGWALGLLVVPIFIPLLFSFLMVFGYVLLFLGHVLVASAMGENDHPRWPEWQPEFIAEGIGRWLWASLFGVGLAGAPLAAYWLYRGEVAWYDLLFLGLLEPLAVGFALMALAASLMHDTILAANPVTVWTAIRRIGAGYVMPCLVGGAVLVLTAASVHGLLYKMSTMWMEAVALWAFWTFFFYELMVVMRMVGLTYYAHSMELVWFRRRPKWATSRLHGRIYSNS